jgi:hypothetical protein
MVVKANFAHNLDEIVRSECFCCFFELIRDSDTKSRCGGIVF